MRNYMIENITDKQAELVEKFFKHNDIEVSVSENCHQAVLKDIFKSEIEYMKETLDNDEDAAREILEQVDIEEEAIQIDNSNTLNFFEEVDYRVRTYLEGKLPDNSESGLMY